MTVALVIAALPAVKGIFDLGFYVADKIRARKAKRKKQRDALRRMGLDK